MGSVSRGVSLLETLLAGVLLSITFFVILSLFPSSQLAIRQSQQVTRASELAQTLLEECRAQKWESMQPRSGSAEMEGLTLLYDLTVHDSPDGTAGVKRLAVQIRWKDGGYDRSLARETRVSRWNRQ
jgi:hypothetical protein